MFCSILVIGYLNLPHYFTIQAFSPGIWVTSYFTLAVLALSITLTYMVYDSLPNKYEMLEEKNLDWFDFLSLFLFKFFEPDLVSWFKAWSSGECFFKLSIKAQSKEVIFWYRQNPSADMDLLCLLVNLILSIKLEVNIDIENL